MTNNRMMASTMPELPLKASAQNELKYYAISHLSGNLMVIGQEFKQATATLCFHCEATGESRCATQIGNWLNNDC
ncbi:hypothetical protein I2I05_04150 [Hymenobacter sp. BT683]|uniref:Uncharacterized protein n=1 Tax=Hymenobacter jeongseonensis TaxID=2791027 RepID=A0ABS0IE08_9BACT|nr:hypothetical protein [Hymenobacter jeongseonensis]MBF9236581.1 hypothetical protein [Hymenobacter jeongseonensis]